MSSALEVLGMSLPYSSSTPAIYPGLGPLLCFLVIMLTVSCREDARMLQSCQVYETTPRVGPETEVSYPFCNPDNKITDHC